MIPALQESENHKSFLDRLRQRISADMLELVDFAYDLAEYGHKNQFRDGGERYFEHCRNTALILMDELDIYDPEMIMAALLHDMLEDNCLLTPPSRIRLIFGVRVMSLVVTLTKPKKICNHFPSDSARHKFYFIKIRNAKIDAKIIKLCDRLHNLRTLDQCAAEKRERKIKETKDVYMPLIDDVAKSKLEVAGFFSQEFAKCFAQLKSNSQ